jgi:hypothetical protein
MRGRPAIQANRIKTRAAEMTSAGDRVNKSRIARELRVPIRTVFRVLPRISTGELCHMHRAVSLV